MGVAFLLPDVIDATSSYALPQGGRSQACRSQRFRDRLGPGAKANFKHPLPHGLEPCDEGRDALLCAETFYCSNLDRGCRGEHGSTPLRVQGQ